MTPEARELMLYERLQTEKDPTTFNNLLEELLELLGANKERIDPERNQ